MPDVRRLQRLGSTSIVVSLPHRWVKQMGLKPGDVVYVEEVPDGLRISTVAPNYNPIRCVIDAEKVNSTSSLGRLVTACYLQGYDSVRVTSISGLTSSQITEVLSAVDRLPGFEVVEQDDKTITLQSLIDPTKYRLEAIVKRMQVLCASMLTSSIDALVEGMHEKVGEVAIMEKKLDELYFLAVRQILTILRFPSIAKSLGVEDYTEASGYRVVTKVLEEVGDHALVISKEVFNIGEHIGFTKSDVSKHLLDIIDNVTHIFGKAVNSFVSIDFKLAGEVFEEVSKEMERIRGFEQVVLESVKDHNVALSIRIALSRLTDVLNGCKIIAEVTTNKFVKNPSEVCTFEKTSS